jgi:hypothetical protein
MYTNSTRNTGLVTRSILKMEELKQKEDTQKIFPFGREDAVLQLPIMLKHCFKAS